MGVQTTSTARRARKSPSSKSKAGSTTSPAPLIDPQQRRALIAEAAYLRAEQRGFEPGHETEDWLAAEIEVDMALTIAAQSPDSGVQ